MYKKMQRARGLGKGCAPNKIPMLMKLSLAIPLLLAGTLQVQAFAFGQTVTLKKSSISLAQFLREVQKQSGYNIFYNESLLPG